MKGRRPAGGWPVKRLLRHGEEIAKSKARCETVPAGDAPCRAAYEALLGRADAHAAGDLTSPAVELLLVDGAIAAGYRSRTHRGRRPARRLRSRSPTNRPLAASLQRVSLRGANAGRQLVHAERLHDVLSASSSTTRMRAASGSAGPFCANPQPGQGGAGEIAGHRGALQLLPQVRRLRRRRRRAVGRRLPGGLDAEGTRRPVSGASAGRPVELRSKSSNTTLFDSMGSSTSAGSVAMSSAAVPSRARRCVGLSSTRRAAYIQAFATVHDFIA